MASRTKKAALNISANLVFQIIKTILSFVTRTIFIYTLGKEALGLNGLFTNILSMLSLAELGIGSAINFSLYEPLSKNDNNKISALMSFYKKAYRIIGGIVLLLGIALLPFLQFLIKGIDLSVNIYIIYLLFLVNSVSTYFVSYKETLINADQKNYQLVGINIFYLIIMNILQIAALVIYKKFIVYLLTQFIIQFIQKNVINHFITKKYANIDFSSNLRISSKDMNIIKVNVKAMLLHKIGDYCINGTDNLIISSFINIAIVGLYSNYLMIISIMTTFTTLFFNNLTSSLGNLIVTENDDKKYEIYKKIDFVGFIMYGYISIILINIFNSFITIWIGNEYCLDYSIVLAIIVSFYISGQRVAPNTIKIAAGMYDIDKFTPLIQSIVNLVISIILAKYVGLLGVILGTIISSIVLPTWQRPYIVYKHILKKPYKDYVLSYTKNFLVLCLIAISSFLITNTVNISSLLLLIIIKIVVCTIIYCIIIIAFYKNDTSFKYFSKSIIKLFTKKGKAHEKRIS